MEEVPNNLEKMYRVLHSKRDETPMSVTAKENMVCNIFYII